MHFAQAQTKIANVKPVKGRRALTETLRVSYGTAYGTASIGDVGGESMGFP